MKIFKKLVGLIVALSICLSASIMTVSAYTYERLYNKTDEQIEEYLWRQIKYDTSFDEDSDGGLEISFYYTNLTQFLSKLEIPDSYYTDEDAYHDFLEWVNEKYSSYTVLYRPYSQKVIDYMKKNPQNELDWDNRGNYDGKTRFVVRYKTDVIDQFDFVDDKNTKYFGMDTNSNVVLWSYDSQTDNWLCKDKNGKVIDTVKAYHPDESSNTTTSSKPTEQSSTVSTTSNSGGTVSAEPQPDYPGSTPAMPDSPGSTNTEVSSSPVDEPASESPDSNTEVSSSPADVPATDSTVSESTDSPATEEAVADQTVSAEEVEPNNNNAMQTVLIIIGVLIIAGIIVIIVMLNKRKREDNNGK